MRISAVAALIALAAQAWPTTPRADGASCSLTSSSFANSILNPPKGEDTEFFVNTGGVPSVMFLLGNSSSMIRLPPDGASRSWGVFGDTGQYGCGNAFANTLQYHSPCGQTSLDGWVYNTSCPDPTTATCATAPPSYVVDVHDATGQYCPAPRSGNQQPDTDRTGFDPDFATFFDPARVYHDAVVAPVSAGDGWNGTASTSTASVGTFCGAQTDDGHRASCNSCMNSKGYWFDGTYQTWAGPSCANTADCTKRGYGTCLKNGAVYDGPTSSPGNCALPNVWFSGNFLSFYPPKFIVARKVLKDVLQSVRRVRMGVTTFNTTGTGGTPVGDGGTLVMNLNPTCGQIHSPSQYDANRSNILNKLDGSGGGVTFGGPAPLAEALLDIGRLYIPYGSSWFSKKNSTSIYDSGSALRNFVESNGAKQQSVCASCQQSSVILLSDGIATMDGKIPGSLSTDSTTAMTAAVASNTTAKTYAGTYAYNITGISSADCPSCTTAAEAKDTTLAAGTCAGQQISGACDDASSPIQSYLPKVAWYLHNVDLRPDTTKGSDGYYMTDWQVMNVYTIGLGASGNAAQILQDTATAGGGLFNGGSKTGVLDAKSLRDALLRSIEDVNTRSTSFGSAAVSTLQSTASQGVLVPRFEPSRKAHWNGHLFAFDLYSEFTSDTCHIPATGNSTPSNGDYDCDGNCQSVFLRDADGDFIQENSTGAFVKNDPPDRAPCGTGTTQVCGGYPSCGVPSTTPARPFWDAGDKLASLKADGTAKSAADYKAWSARRIYTAIDTTTDRKVTATDGLVNLASALTSDTTLNQLASYMNIKGSHFCVDLADKLEAAGNGKSATIRSELLTSPPVYTTCARVIVQYVMGADVLNETKNACGTWPGADTTSNAYCTRAYQLGDIFHSSPVTVYPPLPPPPVGVLCDAGLHPQCVPSLWESPVPNDFGAGYTSAYHEYQTAYKDRERFALVGANDGLLHAFRNGSSATDVGTGEEIWAFLPPDMLAKLPLFMGTQHQYFVDGNVMVRDVWIDGLANGHAANVSGTVTKDNRKQPGEFHTIAVVGERRGGTHYFALDVSDALDGSAPQPTLLWIYPQPSDPEQLAFGETWSDFEPAPPPIGPVRIDAGATPCSGGALASGTRCYQERWIVFLSGGFDPQYTRGRGVHMVDVEDGSEIFDFSRPPGTASDCTADSDPRCHLNYPVAGTIAMMGWGDSEYNTSTQRPAYFDTATFGDTGGQLWVVRFSAPGQRDAGTGKVTNWYGGRILQVGKSGSTAANCDADYCGGVPFFQTTANVRLTANGAYRVLAGTGDRFNLLDLAGGQCGPDNIRACLRKGCTVKLEAADGSSPGAVFGVDTLGTAAYHTGAPAQCATAWGANLSQSFSAATSSSCSDITQKIESLTITCPYDKTCSYAVDGLTVNETTTKRTSIECALAGGNEFCTAAGTNDPGSPIDLAGASAQKNWYFSARVFDTRDGRRIFTDLAGAIAYDKARLDETSSGLKDLNAYDAAATPTPSLLATPTDDGWKYYFNHGGDTRPTNVNLASDVYYIYRADERVASNSAVEMGCGFWNTMQPAVAKDAWDQKTACAIGTPCKAGKTQIAYTYSASPSTGAPCLHETATSTTTLRVVQHESLVPPNIGKLVAYVAGGQVSFGLTSIRVPGGGANLSLGESQDVTSITEWLPADKTLHACRHADRTGTAPTTCK